MEEKEHLGILFDSGLDPLEYIRENTDYLTRFKEEEIESIKGDYNNNIYILFKDGRLYFSAWDVVLRDIEELFFMDYYSSFAITTDKTIICLKDKSFQDYFGEDCFDKVVTYLFGIAGLKNGKLKIAFSCEVSCCIEPENFYDVEDVMTKDDEILIKKDGKWKTLFIR